MDACIKTKEAAESVKECAKEVRETTKFLRDTVASTAKCVSQLIQDSISPFTYIYFILFKLKYQ